jgi:hypothetical protein
MLQINENRKRIILIGLSVSILLLIGSFVTLFFYFFVTNDEDTISKSNSMQDITNNQVISTNSKKPEDLKEAVETNSQFDNPQSSISNNDIKRVQRNIEGTKCDSLPIKYFRFDLIGTILLDAQFADQDFFIYVLDENMQEIPLITEKNDTNILPFGSQYVINYTQNTIILIKDDNQDCLSLLSTDSFHNINTISRFDLSNLRSNNQKPITFIPKKVPQTSEANIGKDKLSVNVSDLIPAITPPDFTPETLALMMDVAFTNVEFNSLLELKENIESSSDYANDVKKWDEDISIAIDGANFEQRKVISQTVIDLRQVIDTFEINIAQNNFVDANFYIFIGNREYLMKNGAPSEHCVTFQRRIYEQSGDISKFNLYLNSDDNCIRYLNHNIKRGIIDGLGMSGSTFRYTMSIFHLINSMDDFLPIDLDVIALYYHPIIKSKMNILDLINILQQPNQKLETMEVVNKYDQNQTSSFEEIKYSSYTEEEVDYLIEIAFGRELAQDAEKLLKWEQDIRMHLEGEYDEKIYDAFLEIVDELNSLTPSINILADSRNPNYNVFIGPRAILSKISSYFFVDSINVRGLVVMWEVDNQTSYARALVINDASGSIRAQEIRNILLEEMTQGLGLLNDSYRYSESIFYQNQGSNDFFSTLDRKIISMMYDKSVKAGMTESQVRALFD